jgi:hypothetical protein
VKIDVMWLGRLLILTFIPFEWAVVSWAASRVDPIPKILKLSWWMPLVIAVTTPLIIGNIQVWMYARLTGSRVTDRFVFDVVIAEVAGSIAIVFYSSTREQTRKRKQAAIVRDGRREAERGRS